jgi:integrase
VAAAGGLGAFLDKYIAAKRGQVSERSIELLEQTKGRMVARFGSGTLLTQVTPDAALDWRQAMLEEGLSEATVRLHTRNAKSIFNDAVDRELIPRSPFRKLPSAAVAAAREFYLPLADAEKILARLPDAEHRLLFGLARFAGLRVSSESHRLEWGDVDWERRLLTVHARKTGATRVVPVLPRLFELLEEAYEARDEGFDQVLLMTPNNIHRRLVLAVEAAGLARWPDLYQNLRRNAETDFAAKVPDYVAAAFLGHGVAVSRKFYLQIQPGMFDVITGVKSRSALHLALQHGAAGGGKGRQTAKAAKVAKSPDAA